MNKIRVVLVTVIVILFFLVKTQAQLANGLVHATIIPSLPLSVCVAKTTNLVFPYRIKSVDIGSPDLLVQTAKGIENILLVKAAKENFEETNLTVITGDGQLYSFVVRYAFKPLNLNFLFSRDSIHNKERMSNFPEISNEAIMEADAQYVAAQSRSVSGVKDKKYGIKMMLTGLFVRNEILYFKIQLQNRSSIDYDIDLLHFYIKDRKQAIRTASQEIPVEPVFIYGNNMSVKAHTSNSLVYALPKFTIPDKKWVYAQILEKNGGRHLRLKIANGTIVRATLITENPSPVLQ